MRLAFFGLIAAASLLAQQYTADQAGQPPAEVSPAIRGALEKSGFAIREGRNPYCEIWLRASVEPSGGAGNQPGVTLPRIPPGALVGVIHFDGAATDRRGQAIPRGSYTLRYALMPLNDQHQGAAPKRDFLLLAPAGEDRDLNAAPGFEALMALSRKASNSAHPAVLSVRKAESDSPGFGREGDSDWVLDARAGEFPLAIIVAGSASR